MAVCYMMLLLLFAVMVSNNANAQQQTVPQQSSSFSSPLSPKLHAVKIISPAKGQQVGAGKDLTISGTSLDDATANNDCHVSVSVNHVKPSQPTTATGTGGTNDYSKWNFILTSKYTTIKQGPNNKITAKYTCTNNPGIVSYSSVNVTGAAGDSASISPAPAQQQAITSANDTANATITNIQQDSPLIGSGNSTAIESGSTFAWPPSPSPSPSPSTTPASGKLVYLGTSTAPSSGSDATTHPTSGDTTKTKANHSSTSGGKSTSTVHHSTSTVHHSTSTVHHHHSTTKAKAHHSSGNKSKSGGLGSGFHIFPF
jgi:hypothetical protein